VCIFLYPKIRRFSRRFDSSVDTFCTREAYTTIATFTKLPSGAWRVQVRRKGRYVGETFRRHDHAREWATEVGRYVGLKIGQETECAFDGIERRLGSFGSSISGMDGELRHDEAFRQNLGEAAIAPSDC